MDVSPTEMCFACGKKNACGLKMNFDAGDGRSVSHFQLDERFQGWKGIAHGGIVATVLDEAMAWAVMSLKIQAVTSELNVKYKKLTPLNEELTVIAEVLEERGRIVKVQAELFNKSKELLAISSGTYFKVNRLK